MKPKDLTAVLKHATPGEWVALSKDQSQILGRGKTAEEAKKAAKVGDDQIVLLHVPFPNIGLAART